MSKKVKRNKSPLPGVPAGAGVDASRARVIADRSPDRKIFYKKRRVRKWPVHDNFLLRICCVDSVGRFLEGGATRKMGAIPAKRVRERVQTLLLDNVERLLGLALQEKDSAVKKWAGELLAHIVSRILVEDCKLLETNASYRDWRRTIGKKLGTVLHPTAIISQIVQCELWLSERTRDLLNVYDLTGDDWKKEARRDGVRESYWPLRDLEDFSSKSEPQWWKIIWGNIKKYYPGRLKVLRAESVAAEKRLSKFRTRFRQHLQLLAKRRDKRVETR